MPGIGLATIYRNLEQLSESGKVIKLEGDVKRYDGNVHEHFHYRCPRCERVYDIEVGNLVERYDEFCNESSLLGLGVKVEFIKVCKTCNESKGE